MKKTRLLAILLISVLGLGISSPISVLADTANANETSTTAENNTVTQTIKKTKIKLTPGARKRKTVYTNRKPVFVLENTKGLKKKTYAYASSKTKVAKFDEKGNLKLLKKGKTNITITLNAIKKGMAVSYVYKCKLTVKTGVKSIDVYAVGNNKFYVGNKYYLKAQTTPKKSSEKIKWKTSNENIATVSKSGVVKVLGEGTVSIKAYSNKTNTQNLFTVETKKEPGLYFKEGYEVTVDYGKNVQLHPQFVHTAKETIKYTSLDSVTATVTNSGYVKINHPGMCYIKAQTKKWTEYIKVTQGCKKGMLTNQKLKNAGIDSCNKLMIVAHPDDDALWGGAHLMEDGWFVLCLTNNYLPVRRNEFYSMLNKSNSQGTILDYPDIYVKLRTDAKGKYDKDNWENVYDGVNADIKKALSYKEWDQIVTHSPTGETGHRHHLKINKIASLESQLLGIYDKLWYFGKFYYKGTPIPADLPKISEEELAFKQSLVDVYQNEMTSIKKYWDQMIPYENWEKATEYGN